MGDQRLQEIKNLKGSTQLSKFDYTYNLVGTIATWTQQADSSTAVMNTLSYDNADELTNAVQSGGGTASNAYHYDPAGNRLAEITASTTTAGQFNNLNQLMAITSSSTSTTVAGHTSAAISSATVDAIPATISNSTNFTANVPIPSGTNVVSVVAQPTSSSGVLTTQRYQIVASGSTPTSLTYDLNGNVLTDENGNGYTWDGLNRLTKITYSGGATSNFAYDGLSRRVSIIEKNSGGTVTSTKLYLWIGSEIAEERSTGTTVTKRFFPQGEQQSGTDYYYTRDHLGSVRELLNSSGTILTRYSYDPYGRTTTNYLSGSVDATKRYARMYWHQPSGLYLPALRGGYDPNTGKFIQRDWIAENGGINLYGYVGNDPENEIDPGGLYAIPRPPVIVVNPWAGAVLSGLLVGEVINAVGEGTGLYNWLAHQYVNSGHDPFHLNPNPKTPTPAPPMPAPSPQVNPTKPAPNPATQVTCTFRKIRECKKISDEIIDGERFCVFECDDGTVTVKEGDECEPSLYEDWEIENDLP